MEENNLYELLYMHHIGDHRAGGLIEEMMQSWMMRWVRDRVGTNRRVLSCYQKEMYQEALMGLYDALETYRSDRNAGFTTFLKVVVDRRINNFVRGIDMEANEVSMDEEMYLKDDTMTLKEVLPQKDDLSSPEYALSFRESRDALNAIISSMKKVDQDVLYAYSEFENQAQAAQKLDMSKRAYSARLRRARMKLREQFKKERYH